MVINWRDKDGEKANIFEINPWLKDVKEFSCLGDSRMRFVAIVADNTGPARFLIGEERRHTAAVLAGYEVFGRLNKDGEYLKKGKDLKVEEAILVYRKRFSPDDANLIADGYESWKIQYSTILRTIKYSESNTISVKDANGELIEREKTPEENERIQNQCNRINKDKLDRNALESMMFYQEKMAIRDIVLPDSVQKKLVGKREQLNNITSDTVDVNKLREQAVDDNSAKK